MTTPESRLREIAYEVINVEAPDGIPVESVYQAVEAQVQFDEGDLRPPMHHGKPVSDLGWKRNVRNALQREKAAGRLVNIQHNRWALPCPLPKDHALDMDLGWGLVRLAGLEASASGAEWHSTQRHHRYRVSDVRPDVIEIGRLDANVEAPLTSQDVVRALTYLNAAGGRSGRRTLNYTVAIEVAIVHLHPRLAWDETADWIVVTGTRASESNSADDLADTEAALGATGNEGAKRLVTHWRRERKPALMRLFKREYIRRNDGRAPCEVCDLDMQARYPGLESPYVEAHHRVPLSELGQSETHAVTYGEMAFLCANCHRAIHRPLDGAFLSVEGLREIVTEG